MNNEQELTAKDEYLIKKLATMVSKAMISISKKGLSPDLVATTTISMASIYCVHSCDDPKDVIDESFALNYHMVQTKGKLTC